MGLFVTSCSDNDDYSQPMRQCFKDGSVVTGSSDVTATTGQCMEQLKVWKC